MYLRYQTFTHQKGRSSRVPIQAKNNQYTRSIVSRNIERKIQTSCCFARGWKKFIWLCNISATQEWQLKVIRKFNRYFNNSSTNFAVRMSYFRLNTCIRWKWDSNGPLEISKASSTNRMSSIKLGLCLRRLVRHLYK